MVLPSLANATDKRVIKTNVHIFWLLEVMMLKLTIWSLKSTKLSPPEKYNLEIIYFIEAKYHVWEEQSNPPSTKKKRRRKRYLSDGLWLTSFQIRLRFCFDWLINWIFERSIAALVTMVASFASLILSCSCIEESKSNVLFKSGNPCKSTCHVSLWMKSI